MKKTVEMKLKEIFEKFNGVEYSEPDNSGRTGWRSNNCIDAHNDPGKLTLGETISLFKRATGADSEIIREIIEFNYKLEWHHAGYFKKAKTMNKVYFLNSDQICDLALNWNDYYEGQMDYKNRILQMNEFLSKHGIWRERVKTKPVHFFVMKEEMYSRKYGWFKANAGYSIPVYYTGWELSEEDYNLFEEKFRETLKERTVRDLYRYLNLT